METKQLSDLELYDGSVLLRFSPAGHRYKISVDNGKTWEKKVGVTSVLGKVIAKEGLIPWAATLAAQTFVEALEAYEAENGSLDGIDLDSVAQAAKTAHSTAKTHGGDIGSLVHTWIEGYIAGDTKLAMPKEPEARLGIRAFMEWVTTKQVEFLASEQPVYSAAFDYCGTYDVKFKIGDITYMGDFKTSNPRSSYDPKTKRYSGKPDPYPEHFIQIGAYDLADHEEQGLDSDVKNVDAHMVIYITKTGKLHTFTSTRVLENQNAWLAALNLHTNLERLTYAFK